LANPETYSGGQPSAIDLRNLATASPWKPAAARRLNA
jgi:hypothetical protein